VQGTAQKILAVKKWKDILKTTFLHEANCEPPQTRATAFPTNFRTFETFKNFSPQKSSISVLFPKSETFLRQISVLPKHGHLREQSITKKSGSFEKCGFCHSLHDLHSCFIVRYFRIFLAPIQFTHFSCVLGGGRVSIFQARESLSLYSLSSRSSECAIK